MIAAVDAVEAVEIAVAQMPGAARPPFCVTRPESVPAVAKAAMETGVAKKPITDFTPYQNRTLIAVQGKPVSETLLEDRR